MSAQAGGDGKRTDQGKKPAPVTPPQASGKAPAKTPAAASRSIQSQGGVPPQAAAGAPKAAPPKLPPAGQPKAQAAKQPPAGGPQKAQAPQPAAPAAGPPKRPAPAQSAAETAQRALAAGSQAAGLEVQLTPVDEKRTGTRRVPRATQAEKGFLYRLFVGEEDSNRLAIIFSLVLLAGAMMFIAWIISKDPSMLKDLFGF